jgi:hypothetical protein
MIFYQVRDKRTGLWYKRGHQYASNWVDQNEASVWTTPDGPRSVLGSVARYNQRAARFGLSAIREPEVVPIHALPADQDVPSAPKVVFVDGDDWEGLYINGTLVEEGHHVRLEDVMRHLPT